jgi:hypothetical protein
MTDTPKAGAVTPLTVFYGLCALAGAVVPWYFNLRFMIESGEMITPVNLFAAGYASVLAGSLTSDFLVATTAVLVWMVVEARRLGMRHWWAYVVLTFLVAFAFACPLFLLMRELRLRAMRQGGAPPP